MSIQFFQEGISYRIPKKRNLRRWLGQVASEHDGEIDSVNFILCSDDRLLEINRQYLDHDYYTDVISFPYHEPDEPIAGDIYISIDRVKEHAHDLSISTLDELHRVMVHGLLHLLGFGDDSPSRQEEMTRWEDYHLAQLSKMFHVEP